MGRILKPESWEGWEPWTALAMAITIQAYQDLVKGAWHARAIIGCGAEAKDAVRGFKSCEAVTAARYFLESDVWRILSKSRAGWMPKRVQRYVQLVLEADRILREGRGKQRGSRKQGGRTGD